MTLLPPTLVTDEAQLERLKFEARTASALNHPNIVTVHKVGQVDSIHYIAIEFIEGTTLRERITRGPPGGSNPGSHLASNLAKPHNGSTMSLPLDCALKSGIDDRSPSTGGNLYAAQQIRSSERPRR